MGGHWRGLLGCTARSLLARNIEPLFVSSLPVVAASGATVVIVAVSLIYYHRKRRKQA
jgi:hypothetical protein